MSIALTLSNTGVNNAGQLIPAGSADPYWTVSGPGLADDACAYVLQNPLGYYYKFTDAEWIWLDPTGAQGIFNLNYVFTLEFDLTDIDTSTVTLSGQWAVDDSGTIVLNGQTPIGTGTLSLPGVNQNNGNQAYRFTLTGPFFPGKNKLQFVVQNAQGTGGLCVAGLTGTASSGLFLATRDSPPTTTPLAQIVAMVPAESPITDVGLDSEYIDCGITLGSTQIPNDGNTVIFTQVVNFGSSTTPIYPQASTDNQLARGWVEKQFWTSSVLGIDSTGCGIIVRVRRHFKKPAYQTRDNQTPTPTPTPTPSPTPAPTWPAGTGVVVVVTTSSTSK